MTRWERGVTFELWNRYRGGGGWNRDKGWSRDKGYTCISLAASARVDPGVVRLEFIFDWSSWNRERGLKLYVTIQVSLSHPPLGLFKKKPKDVGW